MDFSFWLTVAEKSRLTFKVQSLAEVLGWWVLACCVVSGEPVGENQCNLTNWGAFGALKCTALLELCWSLSWILTLAGRTGFRQYWGGVVQIWSLVDWGLWSGSWVRPAGRVQLIVGNGASVLVRSVGGQVLCSHTGGVLKKWRTVRKREIKGYREKVKRGWWRRGICWERRQPEGEIVEGNNQKQRGRQKQGEKRQQDKRGKYVQIMF